MIPILDFSRFTSGDAAGFTKDLGKACRETGFVVIQNPGIPDGLRAQAFQAAEAFFALPLADKEKVAITTNPHNRGYCQLGGEKLDESSGQADQKEAFNVGLDLAADDPRVLAGEPFRGVNLWPEMPGFRETMQSYFTAMLDMGRALHRAIATDLGLAEHFFAPHLTEPLATLRLLRYPAATGAAGEIGAGAHTDYGLITLLTTDGTPGLQVKPRGGNWMNVPDVPDAYIVNIADMLMRWTNDTYVSTPHRVLPPPRKRLSIAFFLDPNPDSVVTALPGTGEAKYPPVTGADYLASRLNATYDHTFGKT